MGDLDIEIKVSHGNAVAEIARAEQAARKAEGAFTGFANTFAKIAKEQIHVADALSKTRLEALNSTNAFKGLAEQMGREATMLDKIHGPAKRLAEDLQTLEMLHRKGLIAAHEYTAELEKMGSVHGPSKEGMRKPSEGGGIGGAAAGLGLGMAAGAGALVVGELKAGIDRWNEHAQAEIDSTNALLKFYDTAQQANGALREQNELADQLHVKLTTATEAYSAVREASEGLNLTSQQQIGITRTLAEIMDIDGKSIAGVTDVMGRFQYAMTVGNLEFRDLKAITKEYPDTAHAFEEATGKSVVQLEAMAKAGTFNRDVIRQVMEGLENSTATHRKHLEVQLSVTQIQDRMNISFNEALHVWIDMKDKVDAASESYVSLDEKALRLANRFKTLRDQVDAATQSIYAGAAISALAFGGIAAGQAAKDLALQKQLLEQIRGPQKAYHDGVDNLNAMLKSGRIDEVEFNRGLEMLSGSHAKAAGAVAEHVAALKELRNYLIPQHKIGSVTDNIGVGKIAGEQRDASHDVIDTVNMGKGNNLVDYVNGKSAKEAAEAAKVTAELERTKEQIDAIVEHMKPLEDAFVTLATTGKMNWSSMIDSMIADLTRLATRQLEMAVIGSLFGGAGGPINSSIGSAFAGLSGGNHAFGGSYMTPGVGGQDSVPVMFRLTPGERVDFTPPGGRQGADANSAPRSAPARSVVVEDRRDHRALAGSADMDRVVIDVLRRHPQLLRR